MTHTVLLDANQPPARFYLGGAWIAGIRPGASLDDHVPEDWIGSTTTVRHHPSDGLTVLPDGRRLLDAVEADPEYWLGADHVARYGSDERLLVKLLDAGQRLPIHAHPDDADAARLLGAAHGKAEAWHALRGGTVYLGLREPLDPAEALRIVETQDTARLLSLMHEIALDDGATIYVPPGLLHAIGDGIAILEVQQPEDLSILLEWTGFDLDGLRDGHLDLGFATALTAVELDARTPAQIAALVAPAGSDRMLPPEADQYFRLDPVVVGEAIDAGLRIIIVAEGSYTLRESDGSTVALTRGDAALVPAAAGEVTLEGTGRALIARPPRP